MILLTKILSIFLAALVISKTFYDYKRHQEVLTTFLFWTLGWIGIVYISLKPQLFYQFTQSMAKENVGIGTFVGIAFVFLFFITYRIYVKANRLEQKLKDVVKQIGLRSIEE